VIDPLISKRQQLLLATQLCRMVLKVRFDFYDSALCALHPTPTTTMHLPITFFGNVRLALLLQYYLHPHSCHITQNRTLCDPPVPQPFATQAVSDRRASLWHVA
jgi:hypothetical protein